MDWLTFSSPPLPSLPPSCYYLNNAFFASLQRYILLSSNVFERRKSSTSSSTRYNMRSIVGRRVEFRIILFGNCRARNFNIKRDNALLETWIWKKFWKETLRVLKYLRVDGPISYRWRINLWGGEGKFWSVRILRSLNFIGHLSSINRFNTITTDTSFLFE